jgi:hypothetical protein
VPLVQGADVRFFVGRGRGAIQPDEVLLDVPDDYDSLAFKSQAIFQWALANGIDYVAKIDDDVYLQPERLLQNGFASHDYVGTRSKGISKVPYFSGFTYWVSRRAMEILVKEPVTKRDVFEDRWVGTTLYDAGIRGHEDDRFVIINSLAEQNPVTGNEAPRKGNSIIAAAELLPAMMHRIHDEWTRST